MNLGIATLSSMASAVILLMRALQTMNEPVQEREGDKLTHGILSFSSIYPLKSKFCS